LLIAELLIENARKQAFVVFNQQSKIQQSAFFL